MMPKAWFYFRHLCRMSVRSKVSILLTSAGIFIAVTVFAVGTILSDSYYRMKMRAAEEMTDNVLVMSTTYTDPEAVGEELEKIMPGTLLRDRILFESVTLEQIWLDEEMTSRFFLSAKVHGVTDTENVLPLLADGKMMPVGSELLAGRNLTEQDSREHAKVAVIDELTAELLFPEQSVLGKKIGLESFLGNMDVEIVGIVKNSHISKEEHYRLKKEFRDFKAGLRETDEGTASPITTHVQIYCPVGTIEEVFDRDDVTMERFSEYWMYRYEDENGFGEGEAAGKFAQEYLSQRGISLSASSREYWLKFYGRQLANVRSVLNAVTIALCFISGISIMSITFFAMKERIPEIGIRKAFGAGKGDIAFEMVSEILILACYVSIAAVCISYFGCRLAEGWLSEKLYTVFTIRVEGRRLLIPVFIGLLEAFASTILPAFYAAGIKVTDALRFE